MLDLSEAESPSGVKPAIKAKEVVLTASSGERHVFEYAGGTHWTAGFRPGYGMKYTLGILLESGEELTAETTFPDSVAVNDTYLVHEEKRFNLYGDRRFNRNSYDPTVNRVLNQTRNFGFKIMDPSDLEPQYTIGEYFHEDHRSVEQTQEDRDQEKNSYIETHPYQKSCFLWVTARSPQKPEEFPLDALYVPGHEYRSVYLATDLDAVDHFNALPLTFGDLACYSMDNAERIEQAIGERDRELIPALGGRRSGGLLLLWKPSRYQKYFLCAFQDVFRASPASELPAYCVSGRRLSECVFPDRPGSVLPGKRRCRLAKKLGG